jgi:fatty-acyl-CoA synthase
VSRHQGIRWTYAQLHKLTNNLAASLMRMGLAPGERVGIWSQNNAEWLLTQLATAKAGWSWSTSIRRIAAASCTIR